MTDIILKNKGTPLLPKDAEVRELDLQNLNRGSIPTYQQIKSRFKRDLETKDARFALSDLVANQLSVELEEQNRFDRRVAEVVDTKLKELHDASYKVGFTEGREEGKTEAFEQEKARLAKAMEEMAMTTKTLVTAKQSLAEQYERALVDMAFKLARLIVHHETGVKPDIISKTIEAILQKVAKEDDVRIRLSTREYDSISAMQDDLKQLARTGNISFELDQNIKAGDCVVESLSGEIASFIDEKFSKLKDELALSLKKKYEDTGT